MMAISDPTSRRQPTRVGIRRNALALSACLVLCSAAAMATEAGITAKKLLLKDNPKMVLLSIDPTVTSETNGSSGDPRCVPDGGSGLGGSIKLSDGSNSATLTMPCTGWTTNGAGTLYKYKDTTAEPKIVKIKPGLLKVVSPGMGGFPVPNGAATVYADVTIGAHKWCMKFAGAGDGTKLLVKDTVRGACCDATTAGYCWFRGPGSNCDDVCADNGLGYDSATASYAGSGGTDAQCQAVANDLGFGSPIIPTPFDCDWGCAVIGTGTHFRCQLPTSSSSAYPSVLRICACQ